MKKQEVDAAVGMTRKWDAREAGREVARNTIKQLNSPPNFFLLFSTIHYKDHGGFEEFLNGVWDVLPKGTPLIGGTVVGFVNNYGCYTRGASALAVSSCEMDISSGVGYNTKRNPKRAVGQSAEMVKKGLEFTKYRNKFLLNFVSGASVMSIPGQGGKKVLDSGFACRFALLAFGMTQYLLQKGFGREDEVFEEMVKKLPDYHMILGTSMDDYRALKNYQFFNDKIVTNSVINLGMSTNLDMDVCTTHGMKKTDIEFNITKHSKYIIHEINNKSALPEFYRLLNWPEGFLTDKTIFNIIPYYPISPKRNGKEIPVVMPGILKDSILVPCNIDGGNASILTVSGCNLVEAIKKNLELCKHIKPEFALFSTCMTVVGTLGYKMNIIREEILQYFKDKPFLMFLSAGEGTYSPKKDFSYANMSFNMAIFGHDNKVNNAKDSRFSL